MSAHSYITLAQVTAGINVLRRNKVTPTIDDALYSVLMTQEQWSALLIDTGFKDVTLINRGAVVHSWSGLCVRIDCPALGIAIFVQRS